MTDIKERLIDGMRGQAIVLPNGKWLRLDDNNLTLIAERLLRTPGVAIAVVPVCTCSASTLFSGSVGRDCPEHGAGEAA